MHKAVIFDLDGTAITNTPNSLPSAVLVQTIKNAKSKLHLSAATGRPITNAQPILRALGLTDPCVISAGTQIIDPKTNEIIWECHIDANDIQPILDICRPYPYEVIVRNELMGEGAPAIERKLDGSVNVIYIMQCSRPDGETILQKLSTLPNITASGVSSWTNQGLDIHITHRKATKEHAVAKLLKLLNVNKSEAIGIGDGNNDLHLFKAVSTRVAMGNATDLLKSQADIICESVENDGLARYIETIISGK